MIQDECTRVRVVTDMNARAAELNTGLRPLPHPKGVLPVPVQSDPLAAARAIFHKIAHYGYTPSAHDGVMGLQYLDAVEKEREVLYESDAAHEILRTEAMKGHAYD